MVGFQIRLKHDSHSARYSVHFSSRPTPLLGGPTLHYASFPKLLQDNHQKSFGNIFEDLGFPLLSRLAVVTPVRLPELLRSRSGVLSDGSASVANASSLPGYDPTSVGQYSSTPLDRSDNHGWMRVAAAQVALSHGWRSRNRATDEERYTELRVSSDAP